MSTNETKQYFDLHTTGIGYLNRVREVTPGRRALPEYHHRCPSWQCR